MIFALSALFADLLVTAAQINDAFEHGRTNDTFALTCTLTKAPVPGIIFTAIDETAGTTLYVTEYRIKDRVRLKIGDRIRVKGHIASHGSGGLVAYCSSLEKIGEGPEPKIFDIMPNELHSGRFDGQRVRLHGEVRECFRDEIDPSCLYFSVNSCGDTFYAILTHHPEDFNRLKTFEGAEIEITGVCMAYDTGTRRITGRTVQFMDESAIRTMRPAAKDPFAVKALEGWMFLNPAELAAMGRRKLRGRVLAVLGNGKTLVSTGHQAYHLVSFKTEPPQTGEFIEAAGYPETDLYRVNLSNAVWRPTEPLPFQEKPPKALDIGELLSDSKGNSRINTCEYGNLVRFTGEIMDMPTTGSGQSTLTLKCGSFTVPVDISACREALERLTVGCAVDIVGIYVINTENWSPCSPFPHSTGIIIAVREAKDITVLSRPSWWTPQRLLVVVGVLLLVLVAIFIWNRILQRIIDRKSRQLLKEQVGQIKATLRVDERTHLAVELHDTLSQNLSGVACQIAATKGTLPDSASETARYLATAERMLLSCRTELRRCLWDLRGDTLEETNFTEAIRKTLAPVAIGVETIVRFNVSRSRLSDTTAHAVLCIIRELVANAIRHGKAKTIRVAGEFHEGVLSFSVRDDGCGFDPSNCNGPAEGHFGLEGIRERIKHQDGTFTITSEGGKGTRAEVTLASILPNDGETKT